MDLLQGRLQHNGSIHETVQVAAADEDGYINYGEDQMMMEGDKEEFVTDSKVKIKDIDDV